MDTSQIEKTLQGISNFAGVFASDMLPTEFSKPSTFVVNLDPHNLPGSHWIAVTINSNSIAWYFDSYGLPPFIKSLKNFISCHSYHFTFNQHQLQSLYSDICGQYVCLYTLYICTRGYTMKEFVALFNSTDPDRQAREMFHKHFPFWRCSKGQRCLPGIKVSTCHIFSSLFMQDGRRSCRGLHSP